MTPEPGRNRKRGLMVVFWIVAALIMALAWSGVSLRDLLFGR